MVIKNIKKLLVLPILFLSVVMFGQTLTDSLKAHYTFTGNVTDASGNGYDGVNNGATLTEDRFGRQNNAYYFDGASYVDIPDNLMTSADTNWSVSIWINVDNINQGNQYALGNSLGTYFSIGVVNNDINVRILNSGSHNILNNITDTISWYNVTVNYANDSVYSYVNGVFIDRVLAGSMANMTELSIGSVSEGSYYLFNGEIDDIRFYNRILTQSEITEIYEFSPTSYCDTLGNLFSASAIITDAFTNEGAIDQTVISPQSVTHNWYEIDSTSEDLTGLVPGIYNDSIVMVDSGCVLVKSYTVNQLEPCDTVDIILSASLIGDTLNTGIGEIDLSVSGEGTGPYTYLWSNDSTSQDLTNLIKGWYVVTVTDANSCVAVDSFYIYGNGSINFSSDFEDQNFDAEIGDAVFETGTSGGYYIVPNPNKTLYDTSDYVLKVYTNAGTGGRAEYQVPRHETLEKTYIYKWKRYYTDTMWTDIAGTAMINQWKTYPCSANNYGVPDSATCASGGGIFNDMQIFNDYTGVYRARAMPDCNYNFVTSEPNRWHDYTLEVYWTQSENGYYRIWRNDTLFGYSDNMKTMFNEFVEDDCDIYWTTGLYTGWQKTGGQTNDSLIAYLDDIKLYDVDSGYTIASVCPDCEVAPAVQMDSNIYKLNMHYGAGADDGYVNYLIDWVGDTAFKNLASIYGLSNGYDIYFWDAITSSSNSLSSNCFPDAVIQNSDYFTGQHTIELKQLEITSTYTLRLLAAAGTGTDYGVEIWTTEQNRDTVMSYNNLCDMAELTGLIPDENGQLIINISALGGRGYINAVELVEYTTSSVDYCDSITWSTSAIVTDVSTYGGNDGAIDFTVSGGYGDFTYYWNNGSTSQDISGLTATTYYVTVTDDSSCTVEANYVVSQPSNPCDTTTLILTATINSDTNSTGVGEINLTVTGGLEPYLYLWSNDSTTQDLNSLVAGTYSITVTDANGCTGDSSFIVLNYILLDDTQTSGNIFIKSINNVYIGKNTNLFIKPKDN